MYIYICIQTARTGTFLTTNPPSVPLSRSVVCALIAVGFFAGCVKWLTEVFKFCRASPSGIEGDTERGASSRGYGARGRGKGVCKVSGARHHPLRRWTRSMRY